MYSSRPASSAILLFLLICIPLCANATEEAGLSQAALMAGKAYGRALESAASAYAAHQLPKALEELDLADQIQPDVPDTYNMRGAIYAEQHDYEKAQQAFEKAARLDPRNFWPHYNAAELMLLQKKYGAAAAAFQKLSVYQGHDELVQFKIVFSELLAGKPEAAKAVLDTMKFPCDTPAYYFAHAAWGFARKDEKEGQYWSRAGVKVFGIERCFSFYDALVGVGWLPMRNTDGSVPEPSGFSSIPAPAATPGGLPAFNGAPLPAITP